VRAIALLPLLLSCCVFDGAGLSAAPPADGPGRADLDLGTERRPGEGVLDRAQAEAWPETDAVKPSDTAVKTDATVKPDTRKPDTLKPDTTPKPDTAPGPLFSDDFSTAGGLVGDSSGSWTVAGGEMSQTTCNVTPDAVVPNKSWGDVTAQVRFRGDQACSQYNQAGLMVRALGTTACTGNKYYWCLADFDNEELRVGKLNGACTTSANWTYKAIPAIDLGVWYWMTFSAKGNTLTCTVWGGGLPSAQTLTWTDSTGSPFATGSAGLVTAGLKASFDDFQVTAN
jgi:hypothetical protein